MYLRSRALFVIGTSLCILTLLTLLAGCGGSSSNNSGSTNTGGTGGSGGTGSGNSGGSGSGSGSSGTPGSGSPSVAVVSYVYTADASNINAYAVKADGSLAPAPGSPYAGATNNMIVANGSNVYAIADDNVTLKAYAIDKSNGSLILANSLNAITGNPNPRDVVGYLSLDRTATSLYIGQFNSSGDDGVAFWSLSNGSSPTFMQWVGSSEVFGPPLVWSPDNKYGYSGNCYHISWTVFSYARNSDGTLGNPNLDTGALPPPVDQGNFPCPADFAVSTKGYLAIAYTKTPQVGQFSIATYKINGDGTLTLANNSPVTTASTNQAQSDISFDPTGTYLAMVGNGGIQTFSMDSSGTLSPVAAPQNAGVAFQNVDWDKSNHLFATSDSQLYVWNVNNGMLTPATGSPYAGGGGLAVVPLQ